MAISSLIDISDSEIDVEIAQNVDEQNNDNGVLEKNSKKSGKNKTTKLELANANNAQIGAKTSKLYDRKSDIALSAPLNSKSYPVGIINKRR